MTETGRATLDKAPAGLHEQVPYLFGSAMVGIGLVTLGLASLESRSSAKALDLAYPVSKGFPTAPRTFAGKRSSSTSSRSRRDRAKRLKACPSSPTSRACR